METLSHNDMLMLNRAIGEIYSARDFEAYYSLAFASIRDMIPYEYCSINDVSLAPLHFSKVISSSQDRNNTIKKKFQILNSLIHQHPLVPYFTSNDVFKTTDVLSRKQFMATAIYDEFYRHLDTEAQIGFSSTISPGVVSIIVLNRNNADFSERDRLILALLKPHCVNALRNVTELCRVKHEKDLLQKGARAEGRGVILFQYTGVIVCISPFAQEMLGRYFGAEFAEGDTLPARLLQWFETETDSGKPAKQAERDVFTIEKKERRLTIRLFRDVTSGEGILFIAESDSGILIQRLQHYSLSRRETDVLFWLEKGKTNIEIAAILGMSKRTAEKHLEHIFAKLCVESRSAAVAIIRNAQCNIG